MSGLRLALVVVLVLSTAVFAIGVMVERAEDGAHAEPALAHREGGAEPAGEEAASTGHAEATEEVLGVGLESTPLLVLAVITGLGLAAVAATGRGGSPGVLLAFALIALAWAALDVRELIHQVDESRAGIAVLAAIVAVLHIAAAVLAGLLAGLPSERGGHRGRIDDHLPELRSPGA